MQLLNTVRGILYILKKPNQIKRTLAVYLKSKVS